MTTYAAYNAGLPCKNTACKSHGRPHPNCRCYGEMAAGGEVEPYCSTTRAHKNECEYFADGGMAELPPGVELDPMPEEGLDELPPGVELDAPTDGELPPGVELDPDPVSEEPKDGGGYSLPTSFGDAVGRMFGSGLLQEQATPKAPGEKITDEEWKKTAADYEKAASIGSLVTGGGVVGAAAKIGEAAAGARILPEIIQGSAFLKNAIAGGLIQTADEVSQWLMGDTNPEDASGSYTAIGASALFSGFLGAAGAAATKGASTGLKKLSEEKFGQQALSFLSGIGFAAGRNNPGARGAVTDLASKGSGLNMASFKDGMAFFEKLAAPAGGAIAGGVHGWHQEGVWGALEGAFKGAMAGQALKLGVKATSKYAAPTLLKILSSEGKFSPRSIAQTMDHAAQVAHGSKVIDRTLDAMFKMAPGLSSAGVSAYGGDKLKKDLDDFFGRGGMTQSIQEEVYDMNAGPTEEYAYAEGGEVKKPVKPVLAEEDDGVATHYPAQNMLLSAGRGRVSEYMKSLRPQKDMPKLPFDREPDQRKQKRTYDRAMSIAINPLSVIEEMRKGTVEPEHIAHLKAMYPELTNLLQKRMTDRVVKAQLEGKKPPYKVRQGMSMLLGAALSSDMTPQSIQAAQAVFARTSKSDQQSAGAPKKPSAAATKSLSKSDQAFLTGRQARQRRAQRPS